MITTTESAEIKDQGDYFRRLLFGCFFKYTHLTMGLEEEAW